MAMNMNNCSVNITINNNIQSKECSMCKTMKPLSEYNSHKGHSDGYNSSCKACTNSRRRAAYPENKEYQKQYREDNKERYRENAKEYRKRNKDKIAKQMKEYQKQYREDNREKLNEYARNKYNSDEHFKLRQNLRCRINDALKGKCNSLKTQELIGCSLSFFKEWLAHQFTQEMSFENYGSYWECEHLRPCASFDLTREEEQKRCFNWSNTQPMIKKDNKIKGTKRDPDLEAAHLNKAQMFLNK